MNEISSHELLLAETLIIKRDFAILSDIVINLGGELITPFLPFAALFCKEITDYLNNMGVSVSFPITSKYSIADIRNKTKFFDMSTNKLLETIRFVDELQDNYFSGLLRFEFLKWFNLHYNLGVYFSDKKIMGNTHYAFYILQNDKELLKQFSDHKKYEILSTQAKSLGIDLGQIIGVINKAISGVFQRKGISDPLTESVFIKNNLIVNYKDYNTNRIKKIGTGSTRAINVLLLHILSNANLACYGLTATIRKDNGILLRLQYIVLHYICVRINKLNEYIKQNPNICCDKSQLQIISTLVSAVAQIERGEITVTTFRNCLMHLRLSDKDGNPLIKKQYYDISKPYCGLVESLFDNNDYSDVTSKISASLIEISSILEPYLAELTPSP